MNELLMTHLNGWKPSISKGKASPKYPNCLHEWLCFNKSSTVNEALGSQIILCFSLETTLLLVQFRFPQTIEPVRQTFKHETQFSVSFTPAQVRPISSRSVKTCMFVFLDLSPRNPVIVSYDDWGVHGVYNHLHFASYLGSMKPFSVSVSQDL